MIQNGPTRAELDPASLRVPPAARGDVTIVVPTLNPGEVRPGLIAALGEQVAAGRRVIIIDSGSTDGSLGAFCTAGFEVHAIARDQFDHGETRNLAACLAAPAELLVFLTQDALPTGPDAFTRLLAPFADPAVGLVYGRQLPREQAGLIERHARLFNYPERAARRAMPQAASLGIKAVFNSNSFAAYRRRALDAVGGFPRRIIMGEDQVVAARMLLAGWTMIYQPDATVRHSHGYSVLQEFRRYFDIGVFHDHQGELLRPFGRAEAEGQRFLRSELGFLLARSPHRIPESLLRTATKLTGYRLGQLHRRLPAAVKRGLAMNSAYFRHG